jgi:hypothetical protein
VSSTRSVRSGTERTSNPWRIGWPGVVRPENMSDALLDVARGFLTTAPQDRSGEDRTMVVVHVSAENLAADVRAGTSQPAEATCHIQGVGSLEIRDPRRHSAVTIRCWVRSLIGTAWCSRWAALGGWSAPRSAGRCASIRHLKAHHRLP